MISLRTMARMSFFFTGLAWATGAWSQPPSWTRVDLDGRILWQDPRWSDQGRPWNGHHTPLASDHAGRLYVDNGPSLLTLSHVATRVEEFAPVGNPPWNGRALAAGGDGLVFWGEWRRSDADDVWRSSDRSPSSYAVYRDGTAFAATARDGIERAPSPHQEWTPVHRGQTFGQVERFLASRHGTLFALPSADPLLFSYDTGKTWRQWEVYDRDFEFTGSTVRALALDRTRGTPLHLVVKHPRDPSQASLVVSQVWYRTLDSLDLPIPDSLITCIAADAGRVWLGTRGRGIWMAANPRLGFTQANQGLTSLHVEALEVASDGVVYALARDGLYRLGPSSTSLAPRLSTGQARHGHTRLHLPGLPGADPAGAFRADGRAVLPSLDVHRTR